MPLLRTSGGIRWAPDPSFVRRWASDLGRTDWEPLKTEPSYANPCFLSSFLPALSVWHSCRAGLHPVFGLGPALVLISSVLYWFDPRRDTWRRDLDLMVVRAGLGTQVLISLKFCRPKGLAFFALGCALGGACYAAGRILTVRGLRWPGAFVHSGLHVFANLGNLMLLPYVL